MSGKNYKAFVVRCHRCFGTLAIDCFQEGESLTQKDYAYTGRMLIDAMLAGSNVGIESCSIERPILSPTCECKMPLPPAPEEIYIAYKRGEHVPNKPGARPAPRTLTIELPHPGAACSQVATEQSGELRFIIQGTPIGKPRMTRRDKWKQRPCVMRYREWADAARSAAGIVPQANTVYSLDWTAYFAPPPSWSKQKRREAIGTLHRPRPDRDNIDKAILDALFKSDSGIAFGTIRKEWGEPERLEVVLRISP